MRVCSVAIALLMAVPIPVRGQSTWSVAAIPEISVGDGTGPGHDLYQVADATLLPDGRLVVLNAGSDELFVYGSSGDLLSTEGGEGDGPGEYQRLRALRQDGDGGLWVYDGVSGRETHLDGTLKLLGTRPVRYDVGSGTPVPGRLRPFRGGGVPIVRGTLSMMEGFSRGEGLHTDSVSLGLHRSETLEEVVRVSRGETFGVRVGTSGLRRPIPFGPTGLYGSGPGSFVVGSSHSVVFSVLDAVGERVATVEAAGATRRVTSRDWVLYQAELRLQYSDGVRIRGAATNPGPSVERLLAETPRGTEFPLFDLVTIDEVDRVWVREYSLDGPSRRWQIIGSSGLIAFLEVPRDWDVLEFADRHVVVLARNELGVETVHAYQIVQ